MPVTTTYPGVYIDEIPSQVRTIVGVPTSIAAFVGVAQRGPVNQPVHLTSWTDFEREFGGLWDQSLMSYAVFQYYQNGGSEAEIVRVIRSTASNGKKAASTASLDLPAADSKKVTLLAASPGAWGASLRARVDYDTRDTASQTLYNLTVRDIATGREEAFRNIDTTAGSPDALSRRLAGSALVRVADATFDGVRPSSSPKAEPGKDPFADPPKAPPAGGGTPPAGGGTPPAGGGTPPAGGGTPPAGGGTPPAGGGTPPATAASDKFVKATGGEDGDLPDNAMLSGSDSDDPKKRSGIYALKNLGNRIFNLLSIPPVARDTDFNGWDVAAKFCLDHRAMLIVDPPSGWTDVSKAAEADLSTLVSGDNAKNAAVYFPRLQLRDAHSAVQDFVPSGAVAGLMARTDGQRGVWKAPAGIDASVGGVQGLTVPLTDLENGRLNPLGINCIRNFPVIGTVVWGSRTMRGADQIGSEWKYVPIRRTALFIEETLFRGTKWVVFEPNDEPLWSAIRLNIGAFMNSLWRQGAFQGGSPQQAYLVKCDAENNPQNDIDKGIVNILVGFAPLKPAEFVLIHIQQLAGQIQV